MRKLWASLQVWWHDPLVVGFIWGALLGAGIIIMISLQACNDQSISKNCGQGYEICRKPIVEKK